MKNLTTGNDDSRATLVRIGILVAIACMVASSSTGSSTTHRPLPASGRSEKTSTTR